MRTALPPHPECPRVSIVTPSFNQGRFIEKTMLSVLRQDYPNIEYIVVDALSTDGTRAVLEKYRNEIDVLLIERDDGQSDALNKGFSRATGDILAYLNSDDCYAHAGVLTSVVRHFQTHPAVDVLYGPRTYINESGRCVNRFPYRRFCAKDLWVSDFIPQECAFWRRRIYEQAGGYIHRDYDFAMDYELWLRFLSRGAHFLAVNERFALFRSYAAQKSLAQWGDKGLREVARLHQQYLGRVPDEREMDAVLKRHLYGKRLVVRRLRQAANYCRTTLHGIVRKVHRTVPADAWVYQPGSLPGRQVVQAPPI
jgi:glycosyltransferase involved in cell wall biosynthesis